MRLKGRLRPFFGPKQQENFFENVFDSALRSAILDAEIEHSGADPEWNPKAISLVLTNQTELSKREISTLGFFV